MRAERCVSTGGSFCMKTNKSSFAVFSPTFVTLLPSTQA
jgi:hypothetical protein